MSLPPAPHPEGRHQRRGDADIDRASGTAVPGSALRPMGKRAPAHWLFWSYLWRHALLFALSFGVMGMYIGVLDSTGYRSLYGMEMIANIAMFSVHFVVLGLIIAAGTALTVFTLTTSARRLWAAHRAAGWTTAQCNNAYRRQKNEARALKVEARLRDLGIAQMHTQNDVPPGRVPVRGGDTPSARRRADPPWVRVLTRARTFALFATLLTMTGFVATIAFSPLLDRIDVQTVRCEVVSAEPGTSSGGSRGSASTASVLIETSGCGPIVVSRGVTFDNRQEVASSFEPGSEYDFGFGWYSRVVSRDILRAIPTADEYRIVK